MIATDRAAERRLDPDAEALAARLTRAAYDIALAQGIRGAFTDFELRLWNAMRDVVRTEPEASARHSR